MAVAIPTVKAAESIENDSDITNNLPTLQFESALTDEEKDLLVLRARSHAITVSACAQATYLAAVFNEIRQIRAELRHPKLKKSKLLQEATPRDPLLVGIIGCGKLGSQLANCLLTYADVRPEELKISSRRPETLGDLQDRGVRCFHDNARVASSVHLLFICVLPSQLQTVGDEIKGLIPSQCVVYSLVNAVPISRLKHLLGTTNILKPQFKWDLENGNLPWDYTLDINGAIETMSMMKKTCPLYQNKADAIVYTEEKYAELLLYTIINFCTSLRLCRPEVLDILNAVVFGQTNGEDTPVVREKEITKKPADADNLFPRFDLTALAEGKLTTLGKKIIRDEAVRASFIKKYCGVIEQYLQWKRYHENLKTRGF
ncbi:NADP-dependent oxidoreductase domain-containing protein 1-like isoform X2 [Lingula anatina]|uniref:NADP-dependent oxidoreductase domain-containing protein 1 n=1 Tax=Lingula anatina TaxID=7574 RepID=A0A1S3JYK3_LINAN|nr:NADP-dependent oxidoreductase domain-containing protein 1-like isoform X2 [Lingula anatina]|eukprot:XP_013415154.1 NADP-dependent oxidoreductase domain-containing protein 1-like isoform X2 [Lingula anatina]